MTDDFGVSSSDIRLSNKNFRRLGYDATTTSPRTSSRSSQEINDGKYVYLLLLL